VDKNTQIAFKIHYLDKIKIESEAYKRGYDSVSEFCRFALERLIQENDPDWGFRITVGKHSYVFNMREQNRKNRVTKKEES